MALFLNGIMAVVELIVLVVELLLDAVEYIVFMVELFYYVIEFRLKKIVLHARKFEETLALNSKI